MAFSSFYYQKVFAKLFDYASCFLVMTFAMFLTSFGIDDAVYLYLLIATPFIWILPETLLLATWGRTPGFLLLGIAPRTYQGNKLSWKESFRLSLFLEKNLALQWIQYEKSLAGLIKRLVIGSCVIASAFFGKALLEFPQEFGKEVSCKGWVHYTSGEGDFSADFPSKPKIEEKQLEISRANRTIGYIEVKSDHSDQVTYSVAAIDLPRKLRIFSSGMILKGSVSVLLENMPFNAKLISRQLTKHGEHPAIDFHIHQEDTEIKGRLILVGNRLFKVEFAQSVDTEIEEAGVAFIQSFKPNTGKYEG